MGRKISYRIYICVRNCQSNINKKAGLYLGELNWLKRHLSMKLFKLGRLQFAFGEAICDLAEKNIKKGDNVIEVHIPAAGHLLKSECEKSFEKRQ